MRNLSRVGIRNIRIAKSGLVEGFDSVEACAKKLIGVQAQYQQFGEISLFHRVSSGVTLDGLNRVYADGGLIKLWGQRTTVHLYGVDEWENLNAIYAPRRTWVRKHCEELGVDLDDVLGKIDSLARTKRYVGKDEIAALLGEQAKKLMTWGGVLIEASLTGGIYAVPERPKTRFYAHRKWISNESVESWTGDHAGAMEDFLYRYFACYGPATLADFRHWSGLPNYVFMDAFRGIEERLERFDVDGKQYFLPVGDVDLARQDVVSDVKLLGKFDPLFVSFADKGWFADLKYEREIWRTAGHIEAVILIDGEIRGTWRYVIKGQNIAFTCYLFGGLSVSDKKRVKMEAERLAGFLEKELQAVSFE
ncbi:winged helix DNA-binding domain-containing protein [Listeria booriae]|uniref:Winged helix DNA-binding domain-containing protein n=1 Tax=Listeria booriae TaxID=1552123 RepID=A0A7X0Z2V4_9LIST|nr:winged helix DNA-binding domain-containing protein [Listeria booriae]MBC2164878.1 winged helix DNA-binding domain-containing protein [Listeria booriae]MBC2168214.1 winged helix DNA-binding domain-containing protein [Listeria booriae]